MAMASYKEMLALGRDPVRVRAVARQLLASAEDWTEWERDFLEGLGTSAQTDCSDQGEHLHGGGGDRAHAD